MGFESNYASIYWCHINAFKNAVTEKFSELKSSNRLWTISANKPSFCKLPATIFVLLLSI